MKNILGLAVIFIFAFTGCKKCVECQLIEECAECRKYIASTECCACVYGTYGVSNFTTCGLSSQSAYDFRSNCSSNYNGTSACQTEQGSHYATQDFCSFNSTEVDNFISNKSSQSYTCTRTSTITGAESSCSSNSKERNSFVSAKESAYYTCTEK